MNNENLKDIVDNDFIYCLRLLEGYRNHLLDLKNIYKQAFGRKKQRNELILQIDNKINELNSFLDKYLYLFEEDINKTE